MQMARRFCCCSFTYQAAFKAVTATCMSVAQITQQIGSTTAGSAIQLLENVTRFLEGLAVFGFPAAAKFEISDLEAPASDER